MAMSSSTFGGIGSGISDIFGAIGDMSEAKAYGKAAAIATTNSKIALESAAIQGTQVQREIFKTVGAQKAEVGGAGLAESGTALSLLRSSVSQGNLQKQLVHEQGMINSNGYAQEAAAYKGMQGAANAAAAGGIASGIFNIAGSLFGLSDEDLKEGIVKVGQRPDGIGVYEWSYKGNAARFRGPMAQEVQRIRPDAVIERSGVLYVNYQALGMNIEAVL